MLNLGDLGDVTAQQINAIVTTGAQTTTSLLMAFGTVTGPVGAAIAAGIAVASLVANMFRGCGAKCVVASQDANKFEQPLQQNLQAYLQAPIRTKSMQAGFLNNVDTLFNALRTACSDPALGDPGRRCISERLDASACHWQASPGGWSQDAAGNWSYHGYGAAGSGSSCWNWVVGYRDPIANDPAVVDDSVLQQNSADGSSTGGGAANGPTAGTPPQSFNWLDLAIPGGLLLVAVLL